MDFVLHNMLLFASFRLVHTLFDGVFGLGETITVLICAKNENYGKTRLWYSVGWGIGCLIFGYLFDIYSQGFLILTWNHSSAFVLCILLYFWMPSVTSPKAKTAKQKQTRNRNNNM